MKLLLLDIDGVMVVEDYNIPLHPDALDRLHYHKVNFAFLTHRNRGDADPLIEELGMHQSPFFYGCFCANDIMMGSLSVSGIKSLIRNGMLKSKALSRITKEVRIDVQDIAFVDDKPQNLKDMQDNGVGLTLQAPSFFMNDRIVSFDFEDLLLAFKSWNCRNLQRVMLDIDLTGKQVIEKKATLFSKFRSAGRLTRSFIGRG